MSFVFRESGIGSCYVGSGMLGVTVASSRGVEADGALVGGALAVAVGGEDGSGRDGLGTGSGRCLDGLAS